MLSMHPYAKYAAAVAAVSILLLSSTAQGQEQMVPEARRCGGETFQCVTVDGTDTLVSVDVNISALRAALEEAESALEESEERAELITEERDRLRSQQGGAWMLAASGAIVAAILVTVLTALAIK